MAPSAETITPRAQRFPLDFPLHYRKSGVQYWQDGRTINMSRTGILFYADERIPSESVLDIRINFPLKATLVCQGSIVRTEESMFAVRIHRYHLLHERKKAANSTN
jgi:hypothetical protein